jgi:hypothetical protein
MLLATPYQLIELTNLHISSYQQDKKGRTVAPIQYSKNGLTLTGCTILSPPLTVVSYDTSMNRLLLNTTNSAFVHKFNAVQDLLGQTNSSIPLQKLYSSSTLSLYLFPSTALQGTQDTVSSVKPGDTLRCVIRLHNILQLETKTGPILRIQHSVPTLYSISG